jgi:hypothetical protein
MGALLWVQVPPQVDHSEGSEAQLREGDRAWGGSVERIREPMNKNRMEGGTDQGERARKPRVTTAAMRHVSRHLTAPRRADSSKKP